jgi:hypothetical protein
MKTSLLIFITSFFISNLIFAHKEFNAIKFRSNFSNSKMFEKGEFTFGKLYENNYSLIEDDSLSMLNVSNKKYKSHEIEFNFRYGFPTRNLTIHSPGAFTDIAHREMKSLNDLGIVFKYKFNIWKRVGLFLSTGIDFSKSKYYQPIFDLRYDYHLDNVIIEKSRIGIQLLGVHKQFSTADGKIVFDVGIDFVNRVFLNKSDSYTSDYLRSHRTFIDYKYELTTYYGDYYPNFKFSDGIKMKINADYNVQVKFKIKPKMLLNFGVNYSRNNMVFYDYTYSTRYYQNGSNVPNQTYSYGGFFGPNNEKLALIDHFLYSNIGISFKL